MIHTPNICTPVPFPGHYSLMRKVTVTLAPKELLSRFQILNTKSGGDQIEPPNASRVFIPDFDREISVTEMEEVFNKLKEN